MEKQLKKRGRKRKDVNVENITISICNNVENVDDKMQISEESKSNSNNYENKSTLENTENVQWCKKRGRKPKGGKIILKTIESVVKNENIQNVILHLKCSLNDLNDYNTELDRFVTNELKYNPDIPPEIETYNSKFINTNFSTYELNENEKESNNKNYNYAYDTCNMKNTITTTSAINYCHLCNKNINDEKNQEENEEINMKDINQKLKKLKINLYKNTLQDKKSACFWCTYEYDNHPCYIPKYEMDDKIYGYGSFCRPECAVAFLMKENLDDSTKFERYHLLNHIYSKVYDFKKNIKPAPNPYYLLDKFYGNLSIQEYRKLLKTEHLLMIIEKPLSRILPELYEDNDNFILGIYGNSLKQNNTTTSSNIYKVKRQSEKQAEPSKNVIIKEKFGLSTKV